MDEHKKKMKILRKEIGRFGWALLVYYLFLNYAVSMIAEIQMIYEGFRAVIASNSWVSFSDGLVNGASAVMENGWGYILACAVVVCMIPVWKGKDFFRKIFDTKQAMTGNDFLSLACIFFSGQLVFQMVAILEELLLNLLGLSVLESMEAASGGADTFSMFLYMGLAAPVVEEIIFRGVLLRGFEPVGKRFSIVASAILFGFFHGNLVQSPYAFAVGLVLGYVAMEYSIGWAMVLHMLNNLFLGDSLLRLTSFLPEGAADFMFWCLYIVCGIIAIRILIRRRQDISGWLRLNPPTMNAMKAFFTTPSNLIMMIMMSLNAIVMLFL